MPSCNPVYQPTTTTVTYERHKEWSANYLTETVIPNCYQKPNLQRLLLIGAIFLAVVGLGLAIYALVADANTHEDCNGDSEVESSPYECEDDKHDRDHGINVVLGSVGICLVLLSLGMYVCFLKIRGICGRSNTSQSARCGQNLGETVNHVESGHAAGITYKGVQECNALNLEPAAPVEEERHSLMDSKYQSDDTERMMDDDPRIVLKPLRTAEEA